MPADKVSGEARATGEENAGRTAGASAAGGARKRGPTVTEKRVQMRGNAPRGAHFHDAIEAAFDGVVEFAPLVAGDGASMDDPAAPALPPPPAPSAEPPPPAPDVHAMQREFDALPVLHGGGRPRGRRRGGFGRDAVDAGAEAASNGAEAAAMAALGLVVTPPRTDVPATARPPAGAAPAPQSATAAAPAPAPASPPAAARPGTIAAVAAPPPAAVRESSPRLATEATDLRSEATSRLGTEVEALRRERDRLRGTAAARSGWSWRELDDTDDMPTSLAGLLAASTALREEVDRLGRAVGERPVPVARGVSPGVDIPRARVRAHALIESLGADAGEDEDERTPLWAYALLALSVLLVLVGAMMILRR